MNDGWLVNDKRVVSCERGNDVSLLSEETSRWTCGSGKH